MISKAALSICTTSMSFLEDVPMDQVSFVSALAMGSNCKTISFLATERSLTTDGGVVADLL